VSDRSDISGKSRSRPNSEVFKSYRPLQSQLTHLEGETQVIREQTEVSHFTDKEKSSLSKLSEKADVEVTDLKPEPTLSDHIEEEAHVEAEDSAEVQKPEELEEEVTPEKEDEEPVKIPVEEPVEEPVIEVEEEVLEKSVEEIEQTEEVHEELESKVDEKSFEQKSGEVTPKSQKTPSQSASVISGEDVKGIPNNCSEISNFIE
jgi:hypothetical protein